MDGSVIAALTLQGTISLLKGHDGNVLAAKRLHADGMYFTIEKKVYLYSYCL